MRIRQILAAVSASLLLAVATVPLAKACPFCSGPSLTLSEQVAQSDDVALAVLVSAKKPTAESIGMATFRITEVIRGAKDGLKVGATITLQEYRAGGPDTLFLLLGNTGTPIDWGSPLQVTQASYDYIVDAPPPDKPATERLAYFMEFLESSDEMIASDAYGEFANARYEDITMLAENMPQKKLREWVMDDGEKVPAARIALYGLMLGLCGTEEDAKLLKSIVIKEAADYRVGLEGLMSGYLMLTGAKGLDVLDKTKLTKDEKLFSEIYAAMQAIRFMWSYAEGRIEKDRLRQSMRGLLDRPELADYVIVDLARWKDWSIQDRLIKLYGTEGFDTRVIKRAIVRYMLASTKDSPKEPEARIPQHVTKGLKYLDVLREKDPKAVKEAERFFFPG